MTAHTPADAAEPCAGTTSPASLTRLRMREAALRQQAAQLQARAEHLERVGRTQARQLQRRGDSHEKIVLGALVKKAGLDLLLSASDVKQQPNYGDAMPIRRGIARQAAVYDRALILGGLMWLAFMLRQPPVSATAMPNLEDMRANGMRTLEGADTDGW